MVVKRSSGTSYTKFVQAMGQAVQSISSGPINSGAVARDTARVMAKATSLLGYRNYLKDARAWKASQKGATDGFERQLQTEATQALADSRDLAGAALRVTSQLKQSGTLDAALNAWVAATKSCGPVEIQDLWTGLTADSAATQLFAEQGLTPDLLATVNQAMGQVIGRVSVRGGKLTAKFAAANQGQPQTVTLAPSLSTLALPGNLSDLLRQGHFENLVQQFNQLGAASIAFVPTLGGDLQIPDVVFNGAVTAVQGVAQHRRGLQDTGLSTYAGEAGWIILVLIAVVVTIVGSVLTTKYCHSGNYKSAACISGIILLIVGILGLLFLDGVWLAALWKDGQQGAAILVFMIEVVVGVTAGGGSGG